MQKFTFSFYSFSVVFIFLVSGLTVQAQHQGHQAKPVLTKPASPLPSRPKATVPAREHAAPKLPAPSPKIPPVPTPPKPKPAAPAPPPTPADTTHQHMATPDTVHRHNHHSTEETGQNNHGGHDMEGMSMTHSFSRNLPMTRDGSGTGWMPDATPLYAYMKHAGNWGLMMHGSVWLRYNRQNLNNEDKWKNDRRGGSQFDAPNWFMAMAQRQVGRKGLFVARAMISLDPLTVGGDGYPLLFQTGEAFEGKPLIDRQHPHDLFSELAVGYTHMLSANTDVFGYFGYPGEPALGPNAFMHRISAFHNPDAPLSHHWQDATHISFGVATAGIRYKSLKLEGSNFTGREPDEHRYNFDKPRFDSYSYRITANPGNEWSMQFSQGFINSPEELNPEEDVTRTTASVLYSRSFTPENHLTATLAWGLNDSGEDHKEHSVLLEGNLQVQNVSGYGRYEFIQKSGEELAIPDPADGFLHDRFNIHALTIGTSYRFLQRFGTDFNIGLQGSVYLPEDYLENAYGNRPLSAEIYIQIIPSLLPVVFSNYKTRSQTEHLD